MNSVWDKTVRLVDTATARRWMRRITADCGMSEACVPNGHSCPRWQSTSFTAYDTTHPSGGPKKLGMQLRSIARGPSKPLNQVAEFISACFNNVRTRPSTVFSSTSYHKVVLPGENQQSGFPNQKSSKRLAYLIFCQLLRWRHTKHTACSYAKCFR